MKHKQSPSIVESTIERDKIIRHLEASLRVALHRRTGIEGKPMTTRTHGNMDRATMEGLIAQRTSDAISKENDRLKAALADALDTLRAYGHADQARRINSSHQLSAE